MSVREGGCSRGEVRYRLASDPLFVHCCHCLNCQRQTGSAFVVNLLIETTVWMCSRANRSRCSFRAERARSRRSGVAPPARPRSSASTRVPAPAPDVHIYTRSKLPWVTLPESVPAFTSYYDPETLWPAPSLDRLAALRKPRTLGA